MGFYRGSKAKRKGAGKCDRGEVKTARQGRKLRNWTTAGVLRSGKREAIAKSLFHSAALSEMYIR